MWRTPLASKVPWRNLARHPDVMALDVTASQPVNNTAAWEVYQKQTHLVAVKLTAAELKLLKLDGTASQSEAASL